MIGVDMIYSPRSSHPIGGAPLLNVEAKAQLSPRIALGLLAQLREDQVDLSLGRDPVPQRRSVRDRLREAGVSFVDLTGNIRVVVENPGLFIEAEGAGKNVIESSGRPVRSAERRQAASSVR